MIIAIEEESYRNPRETIGQRGKMYCNRQVLYGDNADSTGTFSVLPRMMY